MGNLCGKQSSHRDDYFASPGRTLGNANANAGEARKASIPRTTYTTGQNQTPNQGRTVGRAGGGLSSTASGAGSDAQNPRAAAARAAEVYLVLVVSQRYCGNHADSVVTVTV